MEPTAETIEKTFLTCSVCFEVYTRPKCLPCLHTFCSDCLLAYIESKDTYGIRGDQGFPCPVCKQKVNIQNHTGPYTEWVNEIQNNFLIQNMIDCLSGDSTNSPKKNPTDRNDDKSSTSQGNQVLPEITPPPVTASTLPSAPPLDYSSESSSRDPASYKSWTDCLVSRPKPPPPQFHSGLSGESWRLPPTTSVTQSAGAGAGAGANAGAGAGAGAGVSANASAGGQIWIPPHPRVTYRDTRTLLKIYDMTARNWTDYKPTMLSDVCCLPKHNGIIVLDYDNRCVKYVKNVFLRRNVTTAMEVIGRPCSVAVVDKATERVIVVSLLGRNKLAFIRVPELELIDVMDTERTYTGLTVLSPTFILAGSPYDAHAPARLDLIQINHKYKRVCITTIHVTGKWNGSYNQDLYFPHYITSVSENKFVVSDAKKNCLVFFEIQKNSKSTAAVKRFTLNNPYNKFLALGGLCYHSGAVYFVDKDAHEIQKVVLGETVQCETILSSRDGIHKPSSVCVGPSGQVCVVNWDGAVSIYGSNESRSQLTHRGWTTPAI